MGDTGTTLILEVPVLVDSVAELDVRVRRFKLGFDAQTRGHLVEWAVVVAVLLDLLALHADEDFAVVLRVVEEDVPGPLTNEELRRSFILSLTHVRLITASWFGGQVSVGSTSGTQVSLMM